MATLAKREQVRLSAPLLPKPFPLGEIPSLPESDVVIRSDFRELSPEEQTRICDAIDKMMEPEWAADPRNNIGGYNDEASPSEYFRLARYHGLDKPCCVRGRETFPGWHRAYLVDFERTMQAADRALGRDGRLALPYWGWERGAVCGQLLPRGLLERFPRLKPGLIPEGAVAGSELDEATSYQIADERALAAGLKAMKIEEQVRAALLRWEHSRAASTHAGNPDSLETPHAWLLALCGRPLSCPRTAALHPLFFLAACNSDRLYQAYLGKEVANAEGGENAPWNEFSSRLYRQPLRPFRHPATGEPFMPRHTFKTVALGYCYDSLPPVPPQSQQPQQPALLACFENTPPSVLAGRSVVLHVFASGAASAPAPASVPPGREEQFEGLPHYAGAAAVRGSCGTGCENCRTRDPIDIQVDVTDCLRRQGLSRHTCLLEVVAVDMVSGRRVELGEAGLPQPKLVGPLFEDCSLQLARVEAAEEHSEQEAGEVLRLQRHLRQLGWYSGRLDGWLGAATQGALRSFQTFFGLQADGIAGPPTLALMMQQRLDDREDEVDAGGGSAAFPAGGVVRWWAGGAPPYLGAEAVRDEVAAALRQWAAAVPLSFLEVPIAAEADLVISWEDRSRSRNCMFGSQGLPGGVLAAARPGGPVSLFVGVHWLLAAAPEVVGGVRLGPVVLHAIGHALGATHSGDPADVMSPFYEAGRVRLSAGDRARAAAMYPLEPAAEQLFSAIDLNHDGLVSREEFLLALCGRGRKPLERHEAEALFREADTCGWGALPPEQFEALLARLYWQ